MTRTRWLLFTAAPLILVIVGSWLWWVRPRSVDMATYAPADSLLFLESNNPADVVAALTSTDAWKLVDNLTGNQRHAGGGTWFKKFVRWTGIGPTDSVIFMRAQLAVVVTELGIEQDEETLTVKPEGALLVETHTSASRSKPAVEQALKTFAAMAYGQPTLRRTTIDGFEFIEWVAPSGSRRVAATMVGTLVIVGNTERSVQKVLAVVLGRQPNLKSDGDLQRLRIELQAEHALAFGYVPASNSARLLSVAVPMIFGRVPGNTEFERLLGSASAKVISSLGWSSNPVMNAIEDRYRINLQPAIVAKLRESFSCQQSDSTSQLVLPDNFSSVTYYRFQNPTVAWQGLKTSVSSQVDALSAILFSSLLRSALDSYGINDPDRFLSLVDSPVLTLRLEPESPMLIARLRDQTEMRELLLKRLGFQLIDPKPNAETFKNPENEFVARFVKGFVVIGSEPEVDRYAERAASTSTNRSGMSQDLSSTVSDGACVLTYTNDTDRVRAFVSTAAMIGGASAHWSDQSERLLRSLPYSTTETNLEERGIERITRSALGQFSTLLPLVFPARTTDENSRP
jgi:hypothetical protein